MKAASDVLFYTLHRHRPDKPDDVGRGETLSFAYTCGDLADLVI
jgi:hypothetical protein